MEVVEGDQGIGDQERQVWKFEWIGVRLAQGLDRPDQVVAEDPHGTSGKGRQPGNLGNPEAGHVVGYRGVGVGSGHGRARFGFRTAFPDLVFQQLAIGPPEDRAGLDPDE